jgi:uncharacterized membrane protein (GlpM family)
MQELVKVIIIILCMYTIVGYFVNLLLFFLFTKSETKTVSQVVSDILSWPSLVLCFICVIITKMFKYFIYNFPNNIEKKIRRR